MKMRFRAPVVKRKEVLALPFALVASNGAMNTTTSLDKIIHVNVRTLTN